MKRNKKKIIPRKKDEKEILAGILAFAAGVCYLLWRLLKK
jgi:hypothetical protein